ncbi:hypothetical protein Tsubulata_014569 [Turnera subulata]|uniref:BHLH domain-containing protein n=1 Tax=Turnera subulata TaxID=218843 RepID=A0A9Q0J7I5_9ROSI|nr:hypothetical protein Tsubulata_014569 [Turnera subulata]
MSHCVVPNWHLSHQRQEQLQRGESNSSSSSHVHNNKQLLQSNSSTQLVPMSNYEIAELTWENGQLAMHGLGGILHPGQTKPTWGRTGETLESIVHQATYHNQVLNLPPPQHKEEQEPQALAHRGPIVPVPDCKWAHTTSTSEHNVPLGPSVVMKKRTRPGPNQYPPRSLNGSCSREDAQVNNNNNNRSACASAANPTICRENDTDTSMRTWNSFESTRSLSNKATPEDSVNFSRDNDTSMMTWPSFESPHNSLKTKTSTDEDSACHGGSVRQQNFKDRRRDRINQKMKALQKLVPNASKTDKASMLDEVIEYLKQLQAQVQMMSMRNMPQMMMPLGMQQQLQMSLLARMGMGVGLGMGMGMLDMTNMAPGQPQSLPHQLIHSSSPAANPAFVSAPFVVPQMVTNHSSTRTNPEPANTNTSLPLPEPYRTFLAQSMNMELYNKMAALYQQQVNQGTQASSSLAQTNHLRAD